MSFQKFYIVQLNKVQMSRSDWSLLLPAKLSFFLKEPAKLFASITIRQFPFFLSTCNIDDESCTDCQSSLI